jgi:hypothetical protein
MVEQIKMGMEENYEKRKIICNKKNNKKINLLKYTEGNADRHTLFTNYMQKLELIRNFEGRFLPTKLLLRPAGQCG